MKLLKHLKTVILFVILVLSYSCKQEESALTYTSTTKQMNKGKVSGYVYDMDGKALANVGIYVENNYRIGSTNYEGKFTLLSFDKNLRQLITFKLDGYSENQKIAEVDINRTTELEVVLQKFEISNKLVKSGETITGSNFSITFPTNAFVDELGNILSSVKLDASYFDPTNKNFTKAFPGEFYGRRTDNSISAIESFGFIDVNLKNENIYHQAKLAAGKKAIITIKVPQSLQKNAPATIPLWYYDNQKGEWIEEGQASYSNGAYVGTVSHFTPWNCDQPLLTTYLKGKVIDQNNKAVPNARVQLVGIDYNASFSTYTDQNGIFRIAAKTNSSQLLQAKYLGDTSETQIFTSGEMSYEKNIGNIQINITEKIGWKDYSLPNGDRIDKIQFISEYEGWCSTRDAIYYTSNSGKTWEQILYDETIAYYDWIFVNKNSGYLFFRGRVSMSINEKNNANQEKKKGITRFPSDGLYKTNNGGKNWTEIDKSAPSYMEFFKNNLVFENYVKIKYSNNMGSNWQEFNSVDENTRKFKISDENFVFLHNRYAIRGKLELSYSSNKGINWTDFVLNLPFDTTEYPEIIHIEMFDNNNIYIYCKDNDSYLHYSCKTNDAGNTWSKTKMKNSDYLIYFKNRNEGWMYYPYNTYDIQHTIDGGLTWNEESNLYSEAKQIFFANDNIGWILTRSGQLLYTNTGGK